MALWHHVLPFVLFMLGGCIEGGPSGVVEVRSIELCRFLTSSMSPLSQTSTFEIGERVNVSLRLRGRPRSGIVDVNFFLGEHLLSTSTINLADISRDLLFSSHQDTLLGVWFDPPCVGTGYRVEVTCEGRLIEFLPFDVSQPEASIESLLIQGFLAKNGGSGTNQAIPTRHFGPTDEVFFVGRADIGSQAWIHLDWFVGQQLLDGSTRDLVAHTNQYNVEFAFRARPEAGWPIGLHRAVLHMNGHIVGRYTFRVE